MCDFELVSPEFVARHLGRGEEGGNWRLLEAHFSSPDHPETTPAREVVHIPDTIEVHPSYLEAGPNRAKYYPHYSCPEDGNLLPGAELTLALERLGLTPETPVVVYGREPDGSMAAARLCWALLFAGVRRVRLLDGGLDAWLAFGGPTVGDCPQAWELGAGKSLRPSGTSAFWQRRPELLATTRDIARHVAQDSGPEPITLVDIRKRGEWDGTFTHYYPFFSKAGHIPRAKLQGDWDTLLDMESHQLAPTLRAVEERWLKLGIIDDAVRAGDTTLVFYCGTGWRSSISFLVALLLGLRAKNYDGGFYGWSWENRHPIETEPRPPLLFPR